MMMMMIRRMIDWLFGTLFSLLICSVVFEHTQSSSILQQHGVYGWDCTFQPENDIQLADNIILRNVYHPIRREVTVQLEYDGIGWLGFSFCDGNMVGNHAVVGIPSSAEDETADADDSGSASGASGIVQRYIMTSQSTTGVTVETDASLQDTIINGTIIQTDTTTILTYTRPLIEPNGMYNISADRPNTYLYAYGTNNGPTLSYHGGRGTTKNDELPQITLTYCIAEDGDVLPPTTPLPTISPITSIPTKSPIILTSRPTLQPGGAAAIDDSLSYEHTEIIDSTTNISFVADAPLAVMTVTMIHEGITWLSAGLTDNGLMIGSTVVIGLPDDNTTFKYMLSSKTASGVRLLPDDEQSLLSSSIVQNDTHTILTYTRLFADSVNEPDVPLSGNIRFIWAYGHDNRNTLSNHPQTGRGDFIYNVETGQSQKSKSKDTELSWRTHAFMMAFAWGILVPIAIGGSLLRKIIPLPKGGWFKIHFYTNTCVAFMTFAGFIIAVIALNEENTENHFKDKTHHKIGLIITIITFVQSMSGLLRPSLPHAPDKKKNDDHNDDGENDGENENGADNNNDNEEEDDEIPKKSKLRFFWEIHHRILGVVVLVLALLNCNSGLDEYYERYRDDVSNSFWSIVGGLIGIILILKLITIMIL